jgi:UDP-N-acetylglucosamine--N-acetylmuramyl-(pentapeptide) pyrophosphoryl-undecaprenol N-acetylglucosamine transferase
MEKYFPAEKLVITGNPVRNEILALRLASGGNHAGASGKISPDRLKARSAFGLGDAEKVLLVLGGSLGARTINRAVMGKLDTIIESGISLIWQCGRYYYDETRKLLEDVPGDRVVLKDFIQEMDLAYMAADTIIARAGAITISELCLVGKPAILVPSPNVAEDHQTKNARALVDKSAAVHVPDREAESRMIPEALELLNDKIRRDELSRNLSALAIEDSAGRIAREVIGIMEK